jgi:hypothetical protein
MWKQIVYALVSSKWLRLNPMFRYMKLKINRKKHKHRNFDFVFMKSFRATFKISWFAYPGGLIKVDLYDV